MKTVRVTLDLAVPNSLPGGRIDKRRLDATTEEEIAAQQLADHAEAMMDIASLNGGKDHGSVLEFPSECGGVMSNHVKELAEQAAQLSASERIALVEEILASVTECDADWASAWQLEAGERIAACNRGEIALEDADEVFAVLKAKYPQR